LFPGIFLWKEQPPIKAIPLKIEAVKEGNEATETREGNGDHGSGSIVVGKE
jgi:hypothetical protein